MMTTVKLMRSRRVAQAFFKTMLPTTCV
jgi:hypothetical protein